MDITNFSHNTLANYLRDVGNLKSFAVDYARPSRFLVQMFLGGIVNQISTPRSDEMLSFSCSSVTLPGVDVTTFDKRIGPNAIKLPTDVEYPPATLEFQVSSSYLERTMMEAWYSKIYNKKTQIFGYYKDYVTDIHIIQLDSSKIPVKLTTLHEAYPTGLGDLAYDWEMTDQILKFQSTITYKYWESSSLLDILVR